MRKPAPENKRVFIRFHKDVLAMIEEAATKQNKGNATVVSEIFEQYVASPFPLSPLSSCYSIKRGRRIGKIVGRGTNVTIRKVVDNEIRIRADKEGMTETDFRNAIVFSFLEKEREE